MREIAEKFNVATTTIWCILNPKKAIKIREQTRIRNITKYRTDKNYRKYHSDKVNEHLKKRQKNDAEYRKYHNFMNVKYREAKKK